ncbi:MAG: SAM-dependent methyltransferase, partial [Clostridia bacterium]
FGGRENVGPEKIRIRKIAEGDRCYYQAEEIIDKKAYHKNLDESGLHKYVSDILGISFKNMVIYSKKSDYYIKISKKRKLSILKRNPSMAVESVAAHNAVKNYIIPEGKTVDFLCKLGLMNDNGGIVKKYYSKFRQINRFLELVDDEWNYFAKKEIIRVYDLCCGKGYLTLALHYYFTVIKNMSVEILGMDLKKDVIDQLNSIVAELGLEGISFISGDISEAIMGKADIVVALHACDMATDIALKKAVDAEAGMILSVPCCQHELFEVIKSEDLSPILKYGIMKDKFTELATNALRGMALEAMGYDVKMIEFTSLEHTMKNIMIKAVSTRMYNESARAQYYKFAGMLDAVCSAERIMDKCCRK